MKTYEVKLNDKYGDYRVHEYINGVWENEWDGDWTESQAKAVARLYEANDRLNK